jgi:hypothetical protein
MSQQVCCPNCHASFDPVGAVLPEFETIPDWRRRSGMGNTAVYEAIGSRRIVAKKLGRRTVIHVPTGLQYLASLPDADITTGSAAPNRANRVGERRLVEPQAEPPRPAA